MKESCVKKLYRRIIKKLIRMGLFNFLPDKVFLKLRFKLETEKKLIIENPRTFNEKLQWLKINDRNPEYTKMVDKYEVRKYISEKIGEEYLIPLIGVWDNFDDIDFKELPDQFVLKCTHDSGGLVICKDKSKLDIRAARKKINKCLKRDFYRFTREWPYKNVKPRIIAEKYMVDESGTELKDYKFLCFGGRAEYIEVHSGRYTKNHTQDIYDRNWIKTNMSQGGLMSDKTVEKPDKLEEMISFSEILSKEMAHVRIDWYLIDGKVYFGEITFFDGSGFDSFDDYNHDLHLGSLIKIEKEGI